MHERNDWNADLIDLTFDGDQRLIAGRRIYCINNDTVFRFNSGLIFDIHTNQM